MTHDANDGSRLQRFLQQQELTYELDSDWRNVPEVVEALLEPHRDAFAEGRADQLALALRELLFNAVEHGSLGLGYSEKSAALVDGRFEKVLEERAAQSPYSGRRVTVVIRRDAESLEVEIADQGEGFDWSALPDPLDPANILEDHGRGVLLARLSVDALDYNTAGNVVRVRKTFAEADA